jgi:tRNA 2-thiouridine synthesizing protein A
VEVEWDAGELGCARLVLGLRRRIDALAPGQILRIIAHDAVAVHALAAWCRMTGNELLTHAPPTFRVRKTEARSEPRCPGQERWATPSSPAARRTRSDST